MDEFQQVMFDKRDSIIKEFREFPLTKWAYYVHNINFPKEPINPRYPKLSTDNNKAIVV